MEILNFQSFLNNSNKDGKNTSTPIMANIIAIDVNIPNITVGIKLDRLKTENPSDIVIDVVKTAKPALEFVYLIEFIIVLFFLNSL